MYIASMRVRSPEPGEKTGINAYLHSHGSTFAWPEKPWELPENNPGEQVEQLIEVEPGGNRVSSYLDILAPDGTTHDQWEQAITSLFLELMVEENDWGSRIPIPNPVVYAMGGVTLRFGVEFASFMERRAELEVLREHAAKVFDKGAMRGT
jgi:hypothetical protein